MEYIISLILTIAVEFGVPPYFALAIAFNENSSLNPNAVGINTDGTYDLGVMQLNSSWYTCPNWRDPEENVRIAMGHIRWLASLPDCNTWWGVAIAYNAGYSRVFDPPSSSVEYACRVMLLWTEMAGGYVNPVIMKRSDYGY